MSLNVNYEPTHPTKLVPSVHKTNRLSAAKDFSSSNHTRTIP
jgi:hypothetical protein